MKGLNVIQHKIHLTNILLEIYKDSLVGSALGFKGGTATMLFHDLPRFSVDLDFDLIGSKEGVVEKMTKILAQKYVIKDSSTKWNTLFWLLSYKEGETHIKVEVSTRDNPNNHYEKIPFYGASIKVLKKTDMAAHKLVAVIERAGKANRDLFDAHYFLSSPVAGEINYQIIKDRTGLEPKEFYNTLLSAIRKVDRKYILNGLGELLSESQKDWVRAKLLDELVGLVERSRDLM